MKKRFAAGVIFLNPNLVPSAVRALTAAGLEWKYNPDAIDDYDPNPAVFGTVTGETELEKGDIFDWLFAIVDPFNGDVTEWGYSEP
jgi:hypothetical protein